MAIDENPTQDLVDQDARVVEMVREEAALNAAAALLGITADEIDEAIASDEAYGLRPMTRTEYVETRLEQLDIEMNPEDYDN